MVDRYLRGAKERGLEPLVRRLEPVPPLVITLLSFLLGLVSVAATALGWLAAGLTLWVLSWVLDGIDGHLARHTGQQSDLGGYLDILSDLAVYALIPVALWVAFADTTSALSLALLLASFYLNIGSWMYLAALLEKRRRGADAAPETTSVTMPGGIIEGTETFVFFCLFFLLPQQLTWLFGLMALLVFVSALQRVTWAIRTLTSDGTSSERASNDTSTDTVSDDVV